MYIKPRFIGANETGEDIFSYFRSYFNVDNPHEAGIISISASSSIISNTPNYSDISTIISNKNGTRWISQKQKNSSFVLNFHSNYVALYSYTIKSEARYRYIKNWDVYGINNNKKYLIDRRINESICTGLICDEDTIKTFECDNPGFFNKFMVVLTGPDSNNQDYLSLCYIKFYGIVTSNHAIISKIFRCNNITSMHCLVILLLLS